MQITDGAPARVKKNGTYQLDNLDAGTYTLAVSCVGQHAQEETIALQAGETATLHFTLAKSVRALNEVLIIGDKYLVTARKRSNNIARLPPATSRTHRCTVWSTKR